MKNTKTIDPNLHDDYRGAYILERVHNYLYIEFILDTTDVINKGKNVTEFDININKGLSEAEILVSTELQHFRNRIRHFDTELYSVVE
jgi:hypothetical protein